MLQDLTNISRKAMVKLYFLGHYIWIMFKQSTQDRHIVFYKCWETSEAYSVFSFPLLVLFLTRLFSLISNLLFLESFILNKSNQIKYSQVLKIQLAFHK